MKPLIIGPDAQAAIDARLQRHLYGKAKALPAKLATGTEDPAFTEVARASGPEAGTTPQFDPTCSDCNATWVIDHERRPCATHRMDCQSCGLGPDDGVELHDGAVSSTKHGPGVTPIVERWCNACDPPAPVGERYADGQADSWDLALEELVTTAALPREEPKYWGRDRAEWDEHDTKEDLQPWGRSEKR